jgi:hypothetical protein
MATDLWLSDEEVDQLCYPLTQPAAQVRFLRTHLKLTVTTKPNKRAVVVRSHAERVLSGNPAATTAGELSTPAPAQQPNRQALLLRFAKKGSTHGSASKKQSA